MKIIYKINLFLFLWFGSKIQTKEIPVLQKNQKDYKNKTKNRCYLIYEKKTP